MAQEVTTGFHSETKVQVTDKMVRQFAEMSGDHNRIHLDEEYAKTTRFGRRIAHGMIVGALFSRTLVENMGQGGVYLGQTLKFVNPVYIDDVLTISLTVTGHRKEKGIVTVETTAKKENGDFVVKGEAVILLPDSVKSN